MKFDLFILGIINYVAFQEVFPQIENCVIDLLTC